MIYTTFVEIHCLMFHAKFQNHRPSGSREEDFAVYSHGGYLAHVTWTMHTNFGSPFLRMLYVKFGFGEAVQRRRCLNIVDNYIDDNYNNDMGIL